MTRLTRALISHAALRHNLAAVRAMAPGSQILAMIKADAYGHGVSLVAPLLEADALGVCSLDEALVLRQLCPLARIVIVEGVWHAADLDVVIESGFEWVLHDEHQLALLRQAQLKKPTTVWLKIDTGMHRLGFSAAQFPRVLAAVSAMPGVTIAVTMTHFASADAPQEQTTSMQLALFTDLTQGLRYPRSAANSAAIITRADTHFQWVRPGIMLYGISPFEHKTGHDLGLRPVMTLTSEIISIHDCQPGDRIGYGGRYTCESEMRVGVVAIGYGDGYPRSIVKDTCVLVNGKRHPIVGRISMDMLVIDLQQENDVDIGSQVVLWGDGLPVEEIARLSNRFSYELVCQVTARPTRVLVA